MNSNELKSLLSLFNIKPNELLGQNFLLSESVLDEIVAAANLNKDDKVLEIGPGLGALTKRLAEKAGRVVAVEKDRKLVMALRKTIARYKNVEIVEGDALHIERLVLSDKGLDSSIHYSLFANRYKVVANIPYYITGQLLQKFLSSTSPGLATTLPRPGEGLGERSKLSLMVLLLQKEVAERIIAGPGDMSILAVSVQFYADPEIIGYVPKENFYPMPEVDSAIVRLKVLPKARFTVDQKKFFQLVKIGFSSKRKQLQNNLKGVMGGKGGKNLLSSIGLDPQIRAQDLSLADWKRLFDKVRGFML